MKGEWGNEVQTMSSIGRSRSVWGTSGHHLLSVSCLLNHLFSAYGKLPRFDS